MLLEFKHVKDNYTGKIFSDILISILKSYNIRGRVFLIITNNASNNNTLLNALNQKLKKSVNDIFSTDIIRIPYLVYVI
jgi:hypothetical protein